MLCSRWDNLGKNIGIPAKGRRPNHTRQPKMAESPSASWKILYRKVVPGVIVDASHRSDSDPASGDRRQLRETESSIVQVGFSHLRKDLVNRESGSSSGGDTILRTLLRRDPARTLEPIWREHTIYTVIFRRTQDVIIWKRTKVTRAPCRRNLESRGDWIAQTTTFGDTVTSDHKVLDGENESRLRHQHSVVVQDLATRWIQSCPCRNKSAQDTMRRPRVIYADNSWEFMKASEDLPWDVTHLRHVEKER